MDYTIDDFWTARFSSVQKIQNFAARPGWSDANERLEAFEEAGLSLRPDYDDLQQPVWLIAAPGAVGKSTLAKQICAATGAIYLDLAVADTVGGNYITGGLVHTKALTAWEEGQTTLVIDALDEARLRVTQQAFEDFLQDIWRMAKCRSLPVVLLGRVGIMEEAWAIIADQQGVELPIFNIEHFTALQAQSFVKKRLLALAHSKLPQSGLEEYPHLKNLLEKHPSVYENLIDRMIADLQKLASAASEEFVGYAPVLDAVTKLIAAEKNPSQAQGLHQSVSSEVLLKIAQEILERESNKLKEQLQASGHVLQTHVYQPEEQLERLACLLFKQPQPLAPANIPVAEQAAYMEAVNSLLDLHPFLDGAGRAPSNPVFAACISAEALRGEADNLRQCAERDCLQMQHAPNPFLYDFYNPSTRPVVPTGHVGLLYESILAKSKVGDIIGLSIDDAEDGLLAVEITGVTKDEITPEKYQFKTNASDFLVLGRRVAHVVIDAESLLVSLGNKDLLELVAPVAIHCQSLDFQCTQLLVKSGKDTEGGTSVVLEAQEVSSALVRTAPVVNKGAELLVAWPGDAVFPWTDYSDKRVDNDDAGLADLLRIFRRLVMAFRSHSKGRLARFKDKIDHTRMLKDERGRALLEKMKADRIISNEKHMYFLDPDALGEKVGASFQDVKLKRYTDRTLAYLRKLD